MAKLNNHFTPMLNKDSARSVFEQMTQGDQTMAKYYVALKKQAEKCKFPDADDSIRSKILQTMNDKKLRREAMLREYDLSNLLKHAANKEDVERQAASMEKAATEQVNRVYEQRKSNSIYRKKYKPPPKQEMKTTAQKTCPLCGGDHDGPRTKCPASGKTCSNCHKKGHFAVVCRHKNRKRADHVSDQATLEDSEEDEYAFSVTASKKRPTVTVLLNGVKGRMDADSCASANIMDREQFEKITAASNTPIELVPASNNLYAYGQENPIKLRGKFTAPIQSIVTGRKTVAEFLVMENKPNSRPLMSLERATRLGLLHITNSMQTQNDAYSEMREKQAEVLEEIWTATKEDEDFQRLIQHIYKGKEQHLKSNPQLKPFSKIFHELSVVDDVVMRVTQIVIPPKLQERVIEICHEGHLGIVKSKQFLRSKVWFPNIDKKMEAKYKRSLPCQATVSQKPRSPLQMTETPSHGKMSPQISVDHTHQGS